MCRFARSRLNVRRSNRTFEFRISADRNYSLKFRKKYYLRDEKTMLRRTIEESAILFLPFTTVKIMMVFLFPIGFL